MSRSAVLRQSNVTGAPIMAPVALAAAIDEGAAPLYEMLASGADPDMVAEELMKRAEAREKAANDGAATTKETQIARLLDGCVRVIEAEIFEQMQLTDNALAEADAALSVIATYLPADSYYVARCQFVRARLLTKTGKMDEAEVALAKVLPDASIRDPERLQGFADEPNPVLGLLLRAFVLSGKAKLSTATDALGMIDLAGIYVSRVLALTAATPPPAEAADKVVQARSTALGLQIALLIDAATASVSLGNVEVSLEKLDAAEAAVKETAGDDARHHPAVADIDFHRAVVLARAGRLEESALKAGNARQIVVDHTPTDFEKVVQTTDLECNALSDLFHGATAIASLDRWIAYVKKYASQQPTETSNLASIHAFEAKKALCALLEMRLFLLEARGQGEHISATAEDLLAVEGTPEEIKLAAEVRRAEALALRGEIAASLEGLTRCAATATTVAPARQSRIDLSRSMRFMALSQEKEALELRAAYMKAKTEGEEKMTDSEWLLRSASFAAEAGHGERAVSLAVRGVESLPQHLAAIALAPIYIRAGLVNEALKYATVVLEYCGKNAQRNPEQTARFLAEMKAIQAIAELSKLPQPATGDAATNWKQQTEASIDLLKVDYRLSEAEWYRKQLDRVAPSK